MANTATLVTTSSITIAGVDVVYGYSIAIDTINTDLTIRTPAATKMIGVVGWVHGENARYDFSFKSSASTTLVTIENASTTSPVPVLIGQGVLVVTVPGEALIVGSPVIVTSMLLYIIESDRFFF